MDDVLDGHDAGPAAPVATASKTARKLPSGVARDVTERGKDGVLGEGAGLAGIRDDIGPGVADVQRRSRAHRAGRTRGPRGRAPAVATPPASPTG